MSGADERVPRVSVGLPAFKARFFRDALACLRAQTFTDFEVLVYDDASPEDLRTPFEEVCGGDPRFSFVRMEENSAPRFVRNWNRALAAAQGEFFVLGSDDDLYAPDFLEKMVALAEQHSGCDLFYCRTAYFEADPARPTSFSWKNPGFESQVEYLYALLCLRRHAVAPNYFMRRAALCAMGGFVDLPAAWQSDWLTWGQLARRGVVWHPDVLLRWRSSGLNISDVEDCAWAWQKYSAGLEAQPKWQALIEGLAPANEVERWQKAELQRWLREVYVKWQITPHVLPLSVGLSLRHYWREYRQGRLRWNKLVGAVFKRLRRAVMGR